MDFSVDVSKVLSRFTLNTTWNNLTPKAKEMASLSFLDWLGSAAAGGDEKPARIMLETVREMGGTPESTLLPTWEKSSCLNAALVNGTASHIVELDDVHRGAIIHAGAAVIPAALAAAQKVRAAGKELLLSIVLGYEVAIRVGEAVTPSHYYYWHTTGTCGTFGAAAAAGKLLGLNEEQLIWALGNAGTQASGLWEFLADGAMSKHLHPGKAAYNGLLAALLACRGFTGASRILEGERGFCRAAASEFDLDKIISGLGEDRYIALNKYKIEENCFKIHSSCRHTHPAVDLVLDLKKQHELMPTAIKKMVVRTYRTALDITANHNPDTVYAAKFSLPFCVALAMKKGKCGPDEFTMDALDDREIRELMNKVELVLDSKLDSQHPALWPARIEIHTMDGQKYLGKSDAPKGDPENPLSPKDILDKFIRLASGPWGKEKAEKITTQVMQLEIFNDMSKVF